MKKKLAFIFVLNALLLSANDQAIDLGKTVITSNNGFDETLQNTPKNIQVVTAEEISEKNYKNVTEVLENSPLILIKNDTFGQTIEMRGSGANSKATVQVMVDGMSLNPVDINHGTLPLDSIPVSTIERIEILPGGNGVLFGDGATGGVVNIITKTGVDKTESYIGARYGSYSERIFKAGTATKINDNFSVLVNYQQENSKTNRSGERDKNFNIDVTALAKLDEKSNLSVRYGHYERDLTSAELLTREQWKADSRQSGVDFDGSQLPTTTINSITATPLAGSTDILDKSQIVRDDISANYKRELSDNLEFNLTTSYQKTTNDIHQRESTYRNFDGETVNGSYISSNGMAYHTYYADWIGTFTEEKFKVNPSLKYNYDKDSYLIVGYDYKLQKSKRDFDNYMDMYKVYNLDSEKESHGAYVFNKTTVGQFEFMQGFRREWTKYDTTKNTWYYHKVKPVVDTPYYNSDGYVDTGLQTSKIKKSMVNDSYEFAVNYLYSDTGNVYTRFEQSFRTPAPTEFQNKDSSGYTINDLDAETNQTIELGVKDHLYGSNIQLNLFAGRTKGEIYYDEVTHGSVWTYKNLGETHRIGVELNLDQDYGKLFFFEGVSYIKAKVSEDEDKSIEGNYVPYTSKLSANIGTGVRWTDSFNTIATLNYKGKYYLDTANQYEARSYITLDLTANYTFNNGLKLFAGINNLLDRQNFDQEALSDGVQVYDPAIGRSYYVGFDYRF